MTLSYLNKIVVFLQRILFLTILFTLSRFIFLIFNYSAFQPAEFTQFVKAFYFGIRFDLSVIYYCNILFIILSLVPFKFTQNSWYQVLLKVVFVVVNVLLFAVNVIDIGYFPIIKSRSTWAVYTALFEDPSTVSLLKSYVAGYWHFFLIWILFIVVLIKYFPKLRALNLQVMKWINHPVILVILPLLILSGGFGIARGIQGMPLRLVSANDYVKPEYSSLVLNTPFSLVNTIGHSVFEGKEYMPFNKAEQYYTPVKKYTQNEPFDHKNVVIIILESFSSEYVFGLKTKEKNYTPFLDSLISEGLVCSNTVSNALNSRNALPAVITSIYPVKLFNYMESPYSLNKLRGLPEILKEEGYHTSFFHGGHNGTMSFDKIVKASGIDEYYGYNEYKKENKNSGDDGAWGIYDDSFFQFTAEKLNTFQEPFFSTLFTLSSHDPYPIPEHLSDNFPEGELPILKSIAYTDYSLKLFFDSMKSEPWFSNTLFVLVADHTSVNVLPEYATVKNSSSIPLLFYSPGDKVLRGEYSGICQQADIMPTVLDLLFYNKSFVAWGNSVFSDEYRFAINHRSSASYITDSVHILSFDGEKTLRMKNYATKTEVLRNDTGQCKLTDLENYFKSFIQNYEYRMIHNKLYDTIPITEMLDEELL